jgi:hypothetical protein
MTIPLVEVRGGRVARWSLVRAQRAHGRGRAAWSVLVLADRDTQPGIHNCGFYPVAKNNREGSGSNKFCLAVLAWEKARLTAPRVGWVKNVARTFGLIQAAYEARTPVSSEGSWIFRSTRAVGDQSGRILEERTGKLGRTIVCSSTAPSLLGYRRETRESLSLDRRRQSSSTRCRWTY